MPTEKDRYYSRPPTQNNVGFMYGWSSDAVSTGTANSVTGNWMPAQFDGSGNLKVALNGAVFTGSLSIDDTIGVTGGFVNVNITGQTIPLNVTGRLNVNITGQTVPLFVTGNFFANPVGVTGIDFDAPSGYSGSRFLSVGGRAVDSDTFTPQYASGGNAESNFDKDNGGLLVNQGCLNKDIDNVMVWYSGGAVANNTSVGSFGTNTPANGILFNANAARTEFFIQAMGTGIPTYVKFGDVASAQSFSVLLNPATAAGRAGDSFRDERWRGVVYVSGGAVSAFEI